MEVDISEKAAVLMQGLIDKNEYSTHFLVFYVLSRNHASLRHQLLWLVRPSVFKASTILSLISVISFSTRAKGIELMHQDTWPLFQEAALS